MGNPFKVMIMGYLLPLFTAVVALLIPEYDQQYIKWIVAVFVLLLLLPIVFSLRFTANKKIAYRLTIAYQLYAFTFFAAFPLLKVLKGSIVIQLLLVGLFIGIYFLAIFDQRTEVPIVFPDSDKRKWLAIPFYAIPVFLAVFGFGGDHRVARRFFETHGYDFAMTYTSIILYLFACWLLFLFTSLAYKSLVKKVE
ncbi:hypothetical protein M3152_03410 [Sporosarcina luteola]|uniref:hypothetical protein n=1 Tax=Sporosarcina luteola TaxID=582850 RepID=UPI00203C6513|nr:hypothetical protein [Sporosarcina luteola]MCM3636755.1 hypothetical protein [Sporosarcina luteola]